MTSGNLDPPRGAEVARVAEEQLGGQHAAADRPSLAVQVGEDGVEQPGALHQAGFQYAPVRGRQDQRQCVEVPRAWHRGAVAVGDRVAVRIDLNVGDAVVVDELTHYGAQLLQSPVPAFADALGDFLPGRAHVPRGVDELVVPGARAAAQVEQ